MEESVGTWNRLKIIGVIAFTGFVILVAVPKLHADVDEKNQPSPQLPVTYQVTNTNDSGNGSFRQAILNANSHPGRDTIIFNIPGTGVHSIYGNTGLPAITDAVVIDGLSQPGASNTSWPPTLKIEITAPPGAGSFGILIQANDCLIQGLIINKAGRGLTINGEANQIKGNFIGTDHTGTIAVPNEFGVDVAGTNAKNNLIGGPNLGERNLISGNAVGLLISNGASGNFVQGNFIGVNAVGSSALPNQSDGVWVFISSNNLIGGFIAGAGNLISGNGNNGVTIDGSTNPEILTTGNIIAGNQIGVNLSGTAAIGNGADGVRLSGRVEHTQVGGTSVQARNLISGNQNGIRIAFGLPGDHTGSNTIQGNYIGTNLAGTAAIPNQIGIEIGDSIGDQVGGSTIGARNVISGNHAEGIFLNSGCTSITIEGNYIGTNAAGTAALPNSYGVDIAGFSGNPTSDIQIGGVVDGARNVISGNATGVMIRYVASDVRVEGNYVGLDATGSSPLANTSWGIRINNGASSNTVGGLTQGAGNQIAFNNRAGVRIESPSVGNRVIGNSIFSNGGLAIDLISGILGLEGVTANDFSDDDIGANNLQNFPVLSSVSPASVISGSINSTSSTTLRIEYFANSSADASGHGEGEIFLGSQNVNTNVLGNASFTFSFTPVAGKPFISATATNTLTGDTSEFSSSATPTAISLASFTARGYDQGVMLDWQTGLEVSNLGFRLYREIDGKQQLVNGEIIAGSALTSGSTTMLAAGQAYSWWDQTVDNRMADRYWLEDLDLSGQSTWHGPFFVQVVGGPAPARKQAELLSHRGQGQATESDAVRPNELPTTESRSDIAELKNAELSLTVNPTEINLAGESAVKIATRGAGWFRVNRQELLAAGLNTNINPQLLQLFTNGSERPIRVTGENDGMFNDNDTVEFYAEGVETPFTDVQVHWLIAGNKPGRRIPQSPFTRGEESLLCFTNVSERRDRTIYFSALKNGDRENLFGPVISTTPIDQSIEIRQLDGNVSDPATLEILLQGVTLSPHQVAVRLNGTLLGEVSFSGQEQGIEKFLIKHSMLNEGLNEVKLMATAGPSDISLVDAIRVSYRHKFTAEDNRLRFLAAGNRVIKVDGFSNADIHILDVTDPASPQWIAASIEQQDGNFSARLTTPPAGDRLLLAFAKDGARRPLSVTRNMPSFWRRSANRADLIIITRTDLIDSLKPLIDLRKNQGLAVVVVDIEDLYDEFNHGQKSLQAIKDFLAYARREWKRKPTYALLAGDTSFDPKNYLGLGDQDVVPTKLIDTEFMETASDDWLADFDNDGLPELAIGRLPVKTLGEIKTLVSKLINYEKQPVVKSILLAADLSDGFDFAAALSTLTPLVSNEYSVDLVRRDSGSPEAVREKLMALIQKGQKIVNYAGHGSANLWRGEFLSSAAAETMNNETLPLFIMMTCLNGYYHDPNRESLAEALLKTDGGGAIAVWASTGMTLPEPQAILNQEFYKQLFGNNLRLGDVVRRAKLSISDKDVRATWVLFGDPSLKLR